MAAKRQGGVSGLASLVGLYQGKPGALLGILEEIQAADPHQYLSEESLRGVAAQTGEPPSAVYSVATFYSFFNLKPQGEHSIVVCRGTACHTRGSLALLEEAAARLGIADMAESQEPSFTTSDRKFTVRTVACFGQCALAPVVAIDGAIHSRMTTSALVSAINALAKGGVK
jgi:NADH-quinone oxidoreductase subunit E